MVAKLVNSISGLADEILHHILLFLTPIETAFAFGRTCHRFHTLSEQPLLWRHYCKEGFRYWCSRHRFNLAYRNGVEKTDWKMKYIHRHTANKKTTDILNSIIENQVGRIDKFSRISNFGYDVKEVLLHHCKAEAANDALARRYHAITALNLIHRSYALATWDELATGNVEVSLAQILGCFDLFVLRDRHGDVEEISMLLDNLAEKIRETFSEMATCSIRGRAIRILSYLHRHHLVGLASERNYRDLRNNYLHVALQDPEHSCLPLLSATIFCALAQRFGLDARCSGMPSHVYAIVYAKPGEDFDGKPNDNMDSSSRMYFDPYRTQHEISKQMLERMLASWGIPVAQYASHMAPSDSASLAIRASRNILTTVQEFRGQNLIQGQPEITIHGHPYLDLDSSYYSALWANFMLSHIVGNVELRASREFLSLIIEKVERTFNEDCYLLLKYIKHASRSPDYAYLCQTVEDQISILVHNDLTPVQAKARRVLEHDTVIYKVGQVFQHKRYGYLGIVIGWDTECSLDAEWITRNGVDSLSKGRNQSFYNALVEDNSTRYVAEENIEIVRLDAPPALMEIAGRYFKRWDASQYVFVSNILDEYPDN